MASLAWLAGLLEGEGSFIVRNEPATAHQKARQRISVQVAMTDRDVVERVAAIVGHGVIRERIPRVAHHKRSYAWSITAREITSDLMVRLYPYMGERRQAQIREALSTLH